MVRFRMLCTNGFLQKRSQTKHLLVQFFFFCEKALIFAQLFSTQKDFVLIFYWYVNKYVA